MTTPTVTFVWSIWAGSPAIGLDMVPLALLKFGMPMLEASEEWELVTIPSELGTEPGIDVASIAGVTDGIPIPCWETCADGKLTGG